MADNGTPQTQATEAFAQRWLGIIAAVLRILLWPIRLAVHVLFPTGEFDGLTGPVTAKAVQNFVLHLRKLAPSNQSFAITEAWKQTGFEALKAEALVSNSLLFIYLHSPLHRQADGFCQNLLCRDIILNFLNQPNLCALGVSIHTAQGEHLAQMLGAASYPLVALLQPKNRTAFHLVFKVEGPTLLAMRPEHLLTYLNTTLQRHQASIAEQEARRIQREQEIELRRQQDEEYHAALRADQERERLLEEERERERQLVLEQAERERQMQRQEEARLENARALLQPEPSSGGTRIRFVLPSGAKVDRRFQNDENIAALKAFLTVRFHEQQVGIKNIGLSTNFPKKTYHDQEHLTLEGAGLSPQAVIMVQDLDA